MARFGKFLPLVWALGQTIPTSNDWVVWLGPMVQSPVQASAGADLRCVNYCPQAGWYDSCTVSKHASQTTEFAGGSAQAGRRWRKCKNAPHWICQMKWRKTIPPAEGQSPSHQHLIQYLPFFSYYPYVLGTGDCKKKSFINSSVSVPRWREGGEGVIVYCKG